MEKIRIKNISQGNYNYNKEDKQFNKMIQEFSDNNSKHIKITKNIRV
jgi:hypothetical protein